METLSLASGCMAGKRFVLPSRQRGVSLLMALTLVVVVASVISGVSLMTNYALRRSAVLTHNQQATAYTSGAMKLAMQLLKVDKLTSQSDHRNEDWSKPLPAYPVEGGQVQVAIHELSSRFNLKHLEIDDAFEKKVFKRLWKSLGGSTGQAEKSMAIIADKPYFSVIGALSAAAVDEQTIHRLAPYFTYLPINAEKLNVNLVSAPVFAAYLNMTVARAKIILEKIRTQPIDDNNRLKQFAQRQGLLKIKTDALNQNAPTVIELRFGVSSRYFQIVSEARVGDSTAVKVVTVDRGNTTLDIISQRRNKLANE